MAELSAMACVTGKAVGPPDIGQSGYSVLPVGPLLPNTTAKIVNTSTHKPIKQQKENPRDAQGEVCIRGPQVMKGYINDKHRSAVDSDGFLHTGDVGYFDSQGSLVITGAVDQLIKHNGRTFSPWEVESALLSLPTIAAAAVVGTPNGPVAFVVAEQKGFSVAEVKSFVAETLPPHQHLCDVVECATIPTGANGKVLRRLLPTTS